MALKLRVVLFGLLVVACCTPFSLRAEELSIPLPNASTKVSESPININSKIKSVRGVYRTLLSRKSLMAAYRKQLLNEGWKEHSGGGFTKGGRALVVSYFAPLKKGEKTEFGVSVAQFLMKKNVMDARKANPEKLIFMPLYPGSTQLSLNDTLHGVVASYETRGSFQDVVFFYKSGMINYGWSLDQETPAPGQKNNFAKTKIPDATNHSILVFKKGAREKCVIKVASIFVSLEDSAGKVQLKKDMRTPLSFKPSSKTNIFVEYDTRN